MFPLYRKATSPVIRNGQYPSAGELEKPMSAMLEHYQNLAHNLLETLGFDRALHVANQYGWYAVAEEIARLRQTARPTVH
jgi:hypothetical protein